MGNTCPESIRDRKGVMFRQTDVRAKKTARDEVGFTHDTGHNPNIYTPPSRGSAYSTQTLPGLKGKDRQTHRHAGAPGQHAVNCGDPPARGLFFSTCRRCAFPSSGLSSHGCCTSVLDCKNVAGNTCSIHNTRDTRYVCTDRHVIGKAFRQQ